MRPCGTFDKSPAQDMAVFRTRFQWIMLILLLAALFIAIPLGGSRYLLTVMNTIGIVIIATHGINILTGYSGQLSIGHAAFVAVGAYTTAILTHHLNWSFWATIPAAALVAGLVGLIFGLPSLKIKGFYVAMSTLAAHFIIMWLITSGGALTGRGESLIVPRPELFGMKFDSEIKFYFLIMGFAVVMTYITRNLVRTKTGRAFIALRDNDLAAEFSGVNTSYYRILSFTIAAIYAGIAGALTAAYYHLVSVEQFTLIDAIWYIGYIMIGGMGSTAGAIFGVLFLKGIQQVVMLIGPIIGQAIPAFAASGVAGLMQITFGLVLLVFLVFEPRGLAHRWETAKASFRIWPFPY